MLLGIDHTSSFISTFSDWFAGFGVQCWKRGTRSGTFHRWHFHRSTCFQGQKNIKECQPLCHHVAAKTVRSMADKKAYLWNMVLMSVLPFDLLTCLPLEALCIHFSATNRVQAPHSNAHQLQRCAGLSSQNCQMHGCQHLWFFVGTTMGMCCSEAQLCGKFDKLVCEIDDTFALLKLSNMTLIQSGSQLGKTQNQREEMCTKHVVSTVHTITTYDWTLAISNSWIFIKHILF